MDGEKEEMRLRGRKHPLLLQLQQIVWCLCLEGGRGKCNIFCGFVSGHFR